MYKNYIRRLKGGTAMNDKIKSEKYRGLSIASLVTGILTFAGSFSFYFAFFLDNFIIGNILLFIYVICLPVPAIVCGSIDLKRIKVGRYSNKGKGMDRAGIVLGSVFMLFYISWWIDPLIQLIQLISN